MFFLQCGTILKLRRMGKAGRGWLACINHNRRASGLNRCDCTVMDCTRVSRGNFRTGQYGSTPPAKRGANAGAGAAFGAGGGSARGWRGRKRHDTTCNCRPARRRGAVGPAATRHPHPFACAGVRAGHAADRSAPDHAHAAAGARTSSSSGAAATSAGASSLFKWAAGRSVVNRAAPICSSGTAGADAGSTAKCDIRAKC